jgi:hypothetical protein
VKNVGLTALRRAVLAEDCTRASEQTDDPVFRKMLLMLALQWKLAAQEEASKQSTQRS